MGVLKMTLIKTVLLLCLSYHVQADCGEPGNSKSAPLDTSELKASHVYPENYTVWYVCPTKPIAGSNTRNCENGQWTDTIPKCRT